MNRRKEGDSLASYWTALLVAALLTLVHGCKPVEEVVGVVNEKHVVVVEETTRDTVITIEVPVYVKERESRDTVSELSSPFAWSRAEVSGGRLSHSLGTRGEVSSRVTIREKVITIRDTIPYRVEVPIYIEKEIRGWRLWVYYAGVVAIVVASVAAYRRIRRPFS